MVWMGMADDMNPTEWGRKQENNQFIPIMTKKIARRTLENYPLQLFGGMQIL